MERKTFFVESITSDGISRATCALDNTKNVTVEFIGGLPGEEFEGRLIHQSSRRKAKFRAVDTVCTKPLPIRSTPCCAHFGMCGGCLFQEMPYDMQLKIKQQKIEQLFLPFMSQGAGNSFQIRPILPSNEVWGYRNKMEFSFSQDRAGKQFLGLIEGGSKGRVFTLSECHLSDPRAQDVVRVTRIWWGESGLSAYACRTNQGTLRTLTTRVSKTTNEMMVILTVSGVPEYAPKKEQLDAFCDAVHTAVGPDVHIILRIHQAIKGQPTQFFEMTLRGKDHIVEKISIPSLLGDKVLDAYISPKAFFQPNTFQAMRLYETALAMAQLEPHMTFWDLFCGIGVFGMVAAHKVRKVLAVELDPDAAYDAKVNAERFGLDNFTVICGDVGEALKEVSKKSQEKSSEKSQGDHSHLEDYSHCDVALIDPPRAGLGMTAIQQILELKPACLIYVSCNPVTQVADLHHLIEGEYSIEEVAPIDQFPHTLHVENIVRLKRR